MQTKSLVMAGLLAALAATEALAQSPDDQATAPRTRRGPAWSLTPEQRAERQPQVHATQPQLRAKRANGAITPNEKSRLERIEQGVGPGVNEIRRRPVMGPRNGTGPRAQLGLCPLANNGPATTTMAPATGARRQAFGRGFGGGRGWGRGRGWGLQDGTGPRSLNGTCPLLNPPSAQQ